MLLQHNVWLFRVM